MAGDYLKYYLDQIDIYTNFSSSDYCLESLRELSTHYYRDIYYFPNSQFRGIELPLLKGFNNVDHEIKRKLLLLARSVEEGFKIKGNPRWNRREYSKENMGDVLNPHSLLTHAYRFAEYGNIRGAKLLFELLETCLANLEEEFIKVGREKDLPEDIYSPFNFIVGQSYPRGQVERYKLSALHGLGLIHMVAKNYSKAIEYFESTFDLEITWFLGWLKFAEDSVSAYRCADLLGDEDKKLELRDSIKEKAVFAMNHNRMDKTRHAEWAVQVGMLAIYIRAEIYNDYCWE